MSTIFLRPYYKYKFDNKEVEIETFDRFKVYYKYIDEHNNTKFGQVSMWDFIIKSEYIGKSKSKHYSSQLCDAY